MEFHIGIGRLRYGYERRGMKWWHQRYHGRAMYSGGSISRSLVRPTETSSVFSLHIRLPLFKYQACLHSRGNLTRQREYSNILSCGITMSSCHSERAALPQGYRIRPPSSKSVTQPSVFRASRSSFKSSRERLWVCTLVNPTVSTRYGGRATQS